MQAICIPAAYILDLIFGDPLWFPHPVRGIGWLIEKMEGRLKTMIKNERLSGIIFVFIIISLSWFVTFTLIRTAYLMNQFIGLIISIIIIYTTLSVKDLGVESLAVFRALEKRDIDNARTCLSKIVGRDTENLGEVEITRAAVETVAENIVDGIISPLFYAFLGGAPLAMVYKAINTMDSMVGYKNKKYINFGWAAAKIDDAANFIPARMSVIFLTLASWIAGYDAAGAWKVTIRDGMKNPSPNSGLPEAAIAGALGVRLGGINYYKSIMSRKPYIGDDINPLDKSHIKKAVKIAYITSGLFVIAGIILYLFITRRIFL